jgi:hypothetical protein
LARNRRSNCVVNEVGFARRWRGLVGRSIVKSQWRSRVWSSGVDEAPASSAYKKAGRDVAFVCAPPRTRLRYTTLRFLALARTGRVIKFLLAA